MPWFLGWGISWTFLTNSKTSKVLGKIQTLTLGHFLRYSVGDRELLEIVSRKYGFSKIKMCRFKIMASRGVWSLYWATYIVRELHGQPHPHKWASRWVSLKKSLSDNLSALRLSTSFSYKRFGSRRTTTFWPTAPSLPTTSPPTTASSVVVQAR